MPVADLIETESVPIQHLGDCFGVTFSYDVTAHTDPNVIVEVEAVMFIDGGISWISMGKSRRIGGITLDPLTGKPLTKCTSSFVYDRKEIEIETGKVLKQLSLAKDPLIKLIERKSDSKLIIASKTVVGIAVSMSAEAVAIP